MSDTVLSASTPLWPEVPACYGWLSLDRRGGWRLRDEPVLHPGLVAFLNANYGPGGDGTWLVRNGPQKVFVALAYAPWVLRLEADGRLTAHTGADAGRADAAWLDEDGNLLLRTVLGIGLLDDRDLPRLLAQCCLADGTPAGDDALMALLAAAAEASPHPEVRWQDLPLQPIRRAETAAYFSFVPEPVPG